MPRRRRTLESKFIAAAGLGLAGGLALTVAVSVFGARYLSDRSSQEIERGLTEASRELVKKSLDDVGHSVDRLVGSTLADLDTTADVAQAIVDRRPVLDDVVASIARSRARLEPELGYRPEAGILQSKEGSRLLVAGFDQFLQPDHTLPKDVRALLDEMALLDDALISIQKNGPGTLQLYFIGPHPTPFIRLAPYLDAATVFAKLYPEAKGKNFWDFFFTGVVEHWEAQAKDPKLFEQNKAEQLMWPPYDDAGGGGLIVTFFRPVWGADRKGVAGGIGIDITLNDLVKAIADVRLGRSGFAFLVEANTNVLAVSDEGAKVLKLRSEDGGNAGLRLLTRYLGASGEAELAAMKDALPSDGETHFYEKTLGGEAHVIALRKSRSYRVIRDGKVKDESWTLGVTIPRKEIYGPLLASQAVIQETSRNLIAAQVAITGLTLFAVLAGIMFLARRMTAPLAALTRAAQQIRARNYDVSIPEASTDDEIAELTTAFAAMAAESKEHTRNLEKLVSQRTADLNRTLAELWSEMDLARKIQTVLLPDQARFDGYEVAALMHPAANVGGDYYDYFRLGDAQWLLVGDVSGHGVSSGLIMMMAQTAVRATTHTLSQKGSEPAPSEVLSLVNTAIRSNLKKIGHDQYMTVNALRLEKDGVRYAGLHQDLLVYRRATGTVERVETQGVWVGLLDDIAPFLIDAKLDLAKGDVLLLYTDGLTEARVNGRMIGLDALEAAFRESVHDSNGKAIIEGILKRLPVSTFEDDVTLVAVARTES